jgi:ElaB/YqjD/DUF883 family membrane-anchored ribosome-binding protein
VTYTREQIEELSTLESEVESRKARAEVAEKEAERLRKKCAEMVCVLERVRNRVVAFRSQDVVEEIEAVVSEGDT